MIRQNLKFGKFRIEEVGDVILLKEKYVNNLFSDVFFSEKIVYLGDETKCIQIDFHS